jgi:hypothetical protein
MHSCPRYVSSFPTSRKSVILNNCSLQFPESIPNADVHFAAGDAVAWSGIKRSGPAQNMGKLAASNIIKLLLAAEDGTSTVELEKCPVNPPTMSLAIGKQAIGMRGGTMRWGEDVMNRAFGRGLGIEGLFFDCS